MGGDVETPKPENTDHGAGTAVISVCGKEYEVPEAVRVLQAPNGKGTVVLLGTAHVSIKSVEEVEKLVREIKPHIVCIELCRSRANMLQLPDKPPKEIPSLTDEILKAMKAKESVMKAALGCFMMQVSQHLELMPGAEFRAAQRAAKAVDAKLCLGDRDVNITLKRTWNALTMWEKLRFIWSLRVPEITPEDIEQLKNSDILSEMLMELGQQFPSLLEPLIYERDSYLASSLSYCMDSYNAFEKKKPKPEHVVVMGIVGAGHLKGICEQWGKPVDRKRLEELPPPKTSLVRWVALGVMGYGAYCGVRYLMRR